MMNIQKTALLLLCFLSIVACNDKFDLFENYSAYDPVIETLSVAMIGADTVEVVGNILHTGEGELDIVGLEFNTELGERLGDNYVIYEFNNERTTFSIRVAVRDYLETYFFRVFAKNDYAIGMGNIISFQIPYPESPITSCEPIAGTLDNNGWSCNISSVRGQELSLDYYEVTFSCSSSFLRMTFNEEPNVGVYKTVENKDALWSIEPRVHIYINHGSGDVEAHFQQEVYILGEMNDRNMIFCDLLYPITPTLEGKISANIPLD